MPKLCSDRVLLHQLQAEAVEAGRNPKNVTAILYRRRRYAADPVYRERVKAASRARRAAAETEEYEE